MPTEAMSAEGLHPGLPSDFSLMSVEVKEMDRSFAVLIICVPTPFVRVCV